MRNLLRIVDLSNNCKEFVVEKFVALCCHARMKSFAALIFLVACGGGGGGNATVDGSNAASADAHIFNDAPPVVSQMIKFAGTTSESTNTGDTPLAGVTVGV